MNRYISVIVICLMSFNSIGAFSEGELIYSYAAELGTSCIAISIVPYNC